jgi:hypothetical protein
MDLLEEGSLPALGYYCGDILGTADFSRCCISEHLLMDLFEEGYSTALG